MNESVSAGYIRLFMIIPFYRRFSSLVKYSRSNQLDIPSEYLYKTILEVDDYK